MKIVNILGSPRVNGNSATIAKQFCETAEKHGDVVTTYVLNEIDFQGCQGCFLCKTKLDRCAVKDDLTAVLDSIRDADVVVLSSPVYYWDVSGQVKCFLDRTFSFLEPDFLTNPNPSRLPSGKKFVFILAQGNPDESKFTDIAPRIDYFFERYGFTERYLIRACGVRELGDIEARGDLLKIAEETAEKVCGH
jgi:multimeric flavodoxin WrbA